MEDGPNEIFVWGDNFETILDILEEDEEIEEQFSSTVNEKRFSFLAARDKQNLIIMGDNVLL